MLLLMNAAPPQPPVNYPDYFIMNLNLSSGAVRADRSPGSANALGYFWQHKNPQNMGSFRITILSNYFNSLFEFILYMAPACLKRILNAPRLGLLGAYLCIYKISLTEHLCSTFCLTTQTHIA